MPFCKQKGLGRDLEEEFKFPSILFQLLLFCIPCTHLLWFFRPSGLAGKNCDCRFRLGPAVQLRILGFGISFLHPFFKSFRISDTIAYPARLPSSRLTNFNKPAESSAIEPRERSKRIRSDADRVWRRDLT